MALRDQFKTDNKLENDGIWLEFDEVRVRVRRAGKSNKAFLAEMAKHQRALSIGAIRGSKADKLAYEVFGKTVVCGWETMVKGQWVEGIDPLDAGKKASKTGDLLPATSEFIIDVFNELPEFADLVISQASNHESFLAEVREEKAKN